MTPHYPRPAPIEAYGNGGFRFAGMSHKGSILCLPTGIFAWDVARVEEANAESFRRVLDERSRVGFLLLGMGSAIAAPSAELRRAFAEAGISLEPMDTGAAARTWNVLLAEGRPVAAALIAV
jgi:uncharacterized protein